MSISFSVIEEGISFKINTYPNEYKNLMFLLKDLCGLEDFGECGGMGRCGTCLIYSESETIKNLKKERNEPVTLMKFGVRQEGIRLSCQIYVNEALNDSEIELIQV